MPCNGPLLEFNRTLFYAFFQGAALAITCHIDIGFTSTFRYDKPGLRSGLVIWRRRAAVIGSASMSFIDVVITMCSWDVWREASLSIQRQLWRALEAVRKINDTKKWRAPKQVGVIRPVKDGVRGRGWGATPPRITDSLTTQQIRYLQLLTRQTQRKRLRLFTSYNLKPSYEFFLAPPLCIESGFANV